MTKFKTSLLASTSVVALAAAAMLTTQPAMAGTASSQATAAVNDTVVGCAATGATVTTTGGQNTYAVNCTDLFNHQAVKTTADAYAPVMDTVIKVSNSQSLFVAASEVTGLYTQTTTKTKTGGGTSKATAEGGVFERVVACPYTGTSNTAPLGSCINSGGGLVGGSEIAYPGADCQGGTPGKTASTALLGCANGGGVVLDQRIQTLTTSISDCIVNVKTSGGNTLTGTCSFTETIGLTLNTTSVHSVNYILPDVGVGSWVVEVEAAVNANAIVSGGTGTTAVGGAAYGLGSMTVNSVRLVHGFSF